jgi:hypothetical protein
MTRTLRLVLACLLLATALRAEGESAGRKVVPGRAYGANTFAGLFVGALIGTGIGALPYGMERKSQDPGSVILGAVYGAVGGAAILGLTVSAYEVASDKPGAGITVLYNTLGFAVLGGVVGSGAGMISYRRKIGYDADSGEDFVGAAAAGVCAGALLGLGTGLYEAVLWQPPGEHIPGKGIHASVGVMDLASLHFDGQKNVPLTNASLLKVSF